MNALDRLIGWLSPVNGLRRVQARAVLARYEATRPSRTRKVTNDNSTGDVQVIRDAATARAMARDMERNYDIVAGGLKLLVNRVVGPNGISVEPRPRRMDGSINDEFARELLELHEDWSRQPEVTGTTDWVMCQQLSGLSLFRDGEIFAQTIEGPVPYLDHGTRVPFSLEMLEADHCPLDFRQDTPVVDGGVERNAWGRPVAYHMYRQHPGGLRPTGLGPDTLKRVPADRMLHVFLRSRWSQLRGISILVSALGRFQDIQEYENNEMIAARIASAISAYIKRDVNSAPDMQPIESGEKRVLQLRPGQIMDTLLPGEELDLLNPNRPNPNLGAFRRDQHRAAAAGMSVSASSLSKDYNGTYSAQRQELVEQQPEYELLTRWIVARFNRPVWERFVRTAILAGLVKVPADVRPETVAQATFRGPPMVWINPVHEADGLERMVRNGFRSAASVIGERGGRLADTYAELERERKLAEKLGLVLQCDARTDKLADVPAPPDPMDQVPPAPAKARQLNGMH